MTMESIISAYGYYALFLGTFIEGETIVLISGFLAHRGYLDIRLVMLVAWAGSFLGDQVWFYAGRWRGRKMLASRPKWQERAQRLRPMLEKHQMAVLLGFRFAIGFRIATPVILGSIGYSAWKFLVLNAVGAAAWAAAARRAGGGAAGRRRGGEEEGCRERIGVNRGATPDTGVSKQSFVARRRSIRVSLSWVRATASNGDTQVAEPTCVARRYATLARTSVTSHTTCVPPRRSHRWPRYAPLGEWGHPKRRELLGSVSRDL
jgi:membrane protein YqaA with SNARE-associated domain